ncbi:Thymidylate kinase [Gracilariopsis chorda]|uniref:Thymidylate kinase n=1 Tax=Gracilariopsis chorda TaxID=448386 RepID=A0A2V3J381_9FLOR|nr:Thymidylate kinase [Gracilariopsis chorda]|eukprot:PXF48901.1 Thymidylate kinase [Gracilariopsis chorda]
MRGALIVFEGTDRSGKSTQTRNFTNALQAAGIAVAEHSPWSFPHRTSPVGQVINAYLTNKTHLHERALHLLFSANRWEKASQIRQALRRGETVVLDRYAYSGIAYSVAKGLPLTWCKCADEGLPAPDVVVFLHLSPEAAAKRADYGSERYENKHMQTAVAKVFEQLRTEQWLVVDADADEATVLNRILDSAMPTVAKARSTPHIASLWN